MKIRPLTADEERKDAVPIMQQLWTDRDRGEMMAWTGEDDYHLFGAFDDEILVGVAGVRIEDFLHHQRHAWLYDFVVDEPRRGEGIGSALIEHIESWTVDHDCESIALASGLNSDDAHEYYAKRGFEKWGYVIETEL